MKIHRCLQGSPEWFTLRRGIPTASEFHQIITSARGELSKSSRRYAYKLIAERLLNMTTDTLEGQRWVERGKDLEPAAVNQFELVTDLATEPVGFITSDDGRFGASPDRLIVGKAEALEIKCPAPHTHIGYLLDGPGDDYRPQVQGQLYVAELERVHFYSYSDRMPAAPVETTRDEPYIEKLAAALDQFTDQLDEMLERARSLGVFQAFEEAATPADVELADQLRAELDPALREA